MFDKNQSAPKSSQDQQTEKDINLLPEKLRGQEEEMRKKAGQYGPADISYSQVADDNSSPKENPYPLSWWQRLRARLLGSGSDKADKKTVITNPANPLRQLYSQPLRKNPTPQEPRLEKQKTFSQSGEKAEKAKPAVPKPDSASPPFSTQYSQATPPRPDSSQLGAEKNIKKDSQAAKPLSLLERIDQQLQKGSSSELPDEVSSDQFGVNLIPEDMVSEVNERHIIRNLMLAGVIGLILVGAGYMVVEFFQLREARQIQRLQADIRQAEEEFISKSDDLKALVDYQQTYDNIKLLLDSHIYWDKFFSFMENNVADEVYFVGVSADKNGLVSIDMRAFDYEALAVQYKIFKQSPEVISVEVSGANLQQTGDLEGELGLPLLQGPGQLDQEEEESTASSTPDIRYLQKLAYEKMEVAVQMEVQLDTNIFYK